MADTNYNVKVTVDVHGKKVMDELAKSGGKGSGTPAQPGTPGAPGSKAPKVETFDSIFKNLKKSMNSITFGSIWKSMNKSILGGVKPPLPAGGVGAGAGAGAGAAAGGIGEIGGLFTSLIAAITPLTLVIGAAVGLLILALGNSKVIQTVMGTVGKLLGFLVDIILLPLMPFFMMLVRFIYQMIIAFRKFTKALSVDGIIGFIVGLAEGVGGFLWTIVKWAFGAGEYLVNTFIPIGMNIIKGVGGWIWSVLQWIFDLGVYIVHSAIDIGLNIGSTILGFLFGAADLAILLWKWMFGLGAIINTALSLDFVANLIGASWDIIKNLISSGASFVGGVVDFISGAKASGGPVSGGSSYLVGERGPERFTPSSSGTITPNSALSGGNTYTFNNYGQTKSEYELFQKFMELMRQRGRGLTL